MSDVPEWPEVRERFLPTAVAEWSLIQDTMIGGRHAHSSIGVGRMVDREEMDRVRDAGRKSLRDLAEREAEEEPPEEDDEWPDEKEQFWAAVDMSIDLMKEERDQ